LARCRFSSSAAAFKRRFSLAVRSAVSSFPYSVTNQIRLSCKNR